MNMAILILQILTLTLLITGGVYYFIRMHRSNKTIPQIFHETSQSFWADTSSAMMEQREEFQRINAFFLKMLSEKKSKSNYKRMQKEYMELGTRLYFYAGQNTIRKFLEFKHLSAFIEGTVQEHKITLLWFAEFNLLLRNDLGLETSPQLIKDYLNILLTYWEDEEMEEKELDELKIQLSQSIDNYYSVYNIDSSLN